MPHKIWFICIFNMAAKMLLTAYFPVCIPQFLWVGNFYMHLCLRSPLKYWKLSHLHIPYGRENVKMMLRIVYFPVCSPQFLLYGSQIFICISAWVLSKNINIWLICILNMAAKIDKLCSKQHIFLSSGNSCYCIGKQFSYVCLL